MYVLIHGREVPFPLVVPPPSHLVTVWLPQSDGCKLLDAPAGSSDSSTHDSPMARQLVANSIGPRVVVEPAILDWGSVKCLEPVTRLAVLS